MIDKKSAKNRRARRGRAKIRELRIPRLCVHVTPRHTYIQLIAANGAEVIACSSTLEKALRTKLKNGGNIAAAKQVGALIAKRAKDAGITQVAFDRSGYKYHGRVKAVAESAREAGLEF